MKKNKKKTKLKSIETAMRDKRQVHNVSTTATSKSAQLAVLHQTELNVRPTTTGTRNEKKQKKREKQNKKRVSFINFQ